MKKTQRHSSVNFRNSRQVKKPNSSKKKRKLTKRYCGFTILFLIALSLFILFWFRQSHFGNHTTIDGVDCSWLTPKQAYHKLNEHLQDKKISFLFVDTQYDFPGSSFNLKLPSTLELEVFLAKQKKEKKFDFSPTLFEVDESKLTATLKSIPNLDTASMTHAQNASVVVENDLLTILPEVPGNYIDFDRAYHLALYSLRFGSNTIDFCTITDYVANITSFDLQEKVTAINQILETSISFTVPDGSTLTLDKSIMKDWIFVTSKGNYGINIDDNLPIFLEQLSEKCADSITPFEFTGTNAEPVTISAHNLSLDKEAEIALIKSELGTATSHTHTPIFEAPIGNTYVEIDISRQHIWMYVDGKCIVDSDCVTGNSGVHDTPEGYFFLTYKTTNAVLRGYNDNGSKYASPVSYWMPFNGGIGLHDASWRDSFGGSIYLGNGSHGCVNLPKETAQKIYQNIDKTMPIIVYSSK